MVSWQRCAEFFRSVNRSHPLGLTLCALRPILGVLLLIGVAAWLGAELIEEEYEEVNSYDELFVNQQIKRIREGARGDIVFFGDSSGLMGINPLILEKELGRPVQNFCTLGYAGPEAYGIMLQEYLRRNPVPELLVFAFHPVQLPRSKDWEGWPHHIREAFRTKKNPETGWSQKIKKFFDKAVYDRLLYIPLKGSYGEYFGSPKSVENMMRATHGSLIDPGEVFFQDLSFSPAPKDIRGPTEAYWHSLQYLKDILENAPLKNVALLRTPLPDHLIYDRTEIAHAYESIGKFLGIRKNNLILEDLSALPGKYFSGHNHLNRHGKAQFSKLLAPKLDSLLAGRGTAGK